MEIPKSELRAVLDEVLTEELPDHTDKDRESVIDAVLDRMEQEFPVLDDEDEDTGGGEEEISF